MAKHKRSYPDDGSYCGMPLGLAKREWKDMGMSSKCNRTCPKPRFCWCPSSTYALPSGATLPSSKSKSKPSRYDREKYVREREIIRKAKELGLI